jgi:magnesium-transporting ATPase (P-type)
MLIISELPFSLVFSLFNLLRLVFVLQASMIKTGPEHFLKSKQDKRRKSSPIKVSRNGDWTAILWQDVHPGELVMWEAT